MNWETLVEQVRASTGTTPVTQEPLPVEILRRAALVRRITPRIYDGVLSEGIAPAPSFEAFRELGQVERLGETGCTLRETARTEHLAHWVDRGSEVKALSKKLLQKFGDEAGTLDTFLHELLSDPDGARERFLAKYKELDDLFALSGCEALLRSLTAWRDLFRRDLADAIEDRKQYLRSRTLFAEDYYRTVMYLDRKHGQDDFEEFLKNPKEWIFHVHGKGGAGKTVFLRWLIARRCVQEQDGARIPVARMDLDHVDRQTLGEFPWLILMSVMRQLNEQLPHNPFHSRLQSLAEFEALLARPGAGADAEWRAELKQRATRVSIRAADVAPGLKAHRVLIVLDTLEDMLLHQRERLLSVVSLLAELREHGCDKISLVLSGRYHLGEPKRLPELMEKYPGQVRCCVFGEFTEEETGQYFRAFRNVSDPKLIEAIWKKTKGHPLEVSLYGELAASRGGLTVSEIRKYPAAKYARLIERIIDRIPEDQGALRWLLRYAVVPRSLTLRYVQEVINKPLGRESRRQSRRDDPSKYPDPRSQERYGKQERWVELKEHDLQKTWDALTAYAAQTSWVTETAGVVYLNPELVEPMRELLQLNPIYQDQQRASQRYFERLARENPEQWGEWMREAVFHRFQQGEGGAKYWQRQLRTARGLGLQHLEQVASAAFDSDILDENGKPKVAISRTALARAAFELAYTSVIERLRVRSSRSEMGRHEENLVDRQKKLVKYASGAAAHAVSRGKRLLIKGAIAAFEKSETATIRKALPLLDSAELKAVAHYVIARTEVRFEEARPHHLEARRLATLCRSRDLAPAIIDFHLGRMHVLRDELGSAIVHLRRAWKRAGAEFDDMDLAALYRRLMEALLDSGSWTEAAETSRKSEELMRKWPWTRFQWLHAHCRLELEAGSAELAMEQVGELQDIAPDTHAGMVARELEADIEARVAHEWAGQIYVETEAGYKKTGSMGGVANCRMKRAQMLLETGDAAQALEILANVEAPRARMRLALPRLRVLALATIDPKRAKQEWLSSVEDRAPGELVRARMLVVGLALGYGTQSHVGELLRLLRKVRPKEAIYPILSDFVLFEGEPWAKLGVSKIPVARPWRRARGYRSCVLAWAAAMRFFGRKAEAMKALGEALMLPGNTWDGALRQELYRCDPGAYRAVEAGDAPPTFLLEEAMRALETENVPLAAELFEKAATGVRRYPANSKWTVLEKLIKVRLERFSELSAPRLVQAKAKASELGMRFPAWAEEELARRSAALNFPEKNLAPEAVKLEVGLPDGNVVATVQRPGSREEIPLPWISGRGSEVRLESWVDQVLGGPIRWPEVGGAGPVRLEGTSPLLAALPWELLNPTALFYRTMAANGWQDTVRLLQKVTGAVVDGIFGPQTKAYLKRQGVSTPADARRMVRDNASNPQNGPLVVVQAHWTQSRNTHRGHSAEGIRMAELYKRAGVKATEHYYSDPRLLADMLSKEKPGIVHLVSSFWQDSLGDVLCDLEGLTVESLALALKGAGRPVLIVEAASPPNRFEAMLQGLLRNRFCAELFSRAKPKAILGTGLVPMDATDSFVRGLALGIKESKTIGDLKMRHPQFDVWPAALFTNDPELPVWE